MKRTSILVACLLLVFGGYIVLARQDKGSAVGKEGMQGAGMMERGATMMQDKDMMMAKGQMMSMCPMHETMMKMMMQKSLVPTADGGVVVVADAKLMKFDKDLNLVKETEIKIDMEVMQKKMTNMMQGCPMCNTMMQKPSMMGTGGTMSKPEASSQGKQGAER
jgi:hypothetical protein